MADEVGLATRQATAVHLITQHPGTPSKEPTPIWTMQYYDRPYLDIAGVQTGHNGGHRQRCAHVAIEWILHAYPHDFLAGIEWWKLEPAQDLIRNQPDERPAKGDWALVVKPAGGSEK